MKLTWGVPNPELVSEAVNNPSIDDIKSFMSKLDDSIRTDFLIVDSNNNRLLIVNASQDRVVVRFRGYEKDATFPLTGILLDEAHLDSDQKIVAIGEPISDPFHISMTTHKDAAAELAAYFAKNGLLPKGSSWWPTHISFDEFIG
jgi:hypothetical protein